MFFKNWKNEVYTIPNMLSIFRIALIPVYILIYLNASDTSHYFLAAGILAVSCLTDMLDGMIARRFHMISNLGKILDPLADKLTQFSLILCLTKNYPILRYLVMLFVVKESFQLIAGCIYLIKSGKMLKSAQLSGKICTTVLFISLILMVMFPHMKLSHQYILFSLDTVCMVIAFIDYLFIYTGKENQFQSITDPPNTP